MVSPVLARVPTSLLTGAVTVVSPNSYFSFTPFLASTAVGTLEYRCATEPIRGIKHINYAQGWANKIGAPSGRFRFLGGLVAHLQQILAANQLRSSLPYRQRQTLMPNSLGDREMRTRDCTSWSMTGWSSLSGVIRRPLVYRGSVILKLCSRTLLTGLGVEIRPFSEGYPRRACHSQPLIVSPALVLSADRPQGMPRTSVSAINDRLPAARTASLRSRRWRANGRRVCGRVARLHTSRLESTLPSPGSVLLNEPL
jgi:hypothetical protein